MPELVAPGVTAAGDGRRTVTLALSEAEFERLLSALSAPPKGSLKGVGTPKGKHAAPRMRIWRNPKMAAVVNRMIDERFTIDAIFERLEADFGPDQVPGRSSVGRYVRARRLGEIPP